jgi:hypothetical protein
MSLGKTLMKVLVGVAVAKGVSTLTKSMSGRQTGEAVPAGRSTSGRSTGSASGGLEDLLGDVLGNSGRNTTTSPRSTRAGDLLEEITGKPRAGKSITRKTAPKGGLNDVLEQMTGARSGRGGQTAGTGEGGIGDLLGSILGGGALGGALGGAARPAGGSLRIEEEDEISAALMLKAIIQAVKCDGDLDAGEKAKLMEAMGDASPAEVKAVNAELAAPVDIDALVRMVPNGMEAQVYLASLSAIDLDSQAEAQYLNDLAQGLELDKHEVNALHQRLGAPALYR